MIEHLLLKQLNKPIDFHSFEEYQYGYSITPYQKQELNLNEFDIAILGWDNSHYSDIQKALYSLAKNFREKKVIDIGEVIPTPIALVEIVDILLQHNVLPIIISPNVLALEAQLRAYEQRYELLNLALIDSKIQFSPYQPDAIINKLLTHHPHLLFHLHCIGHQSYLNDKKAIDILEDKYFEIYRLGNIQANLEAVEPIVRDIDWAAFSLESIRCADAPARSFKNPNGFLAVEACKIIRYISLSDQLSSLTIHGFDLTINDHGQTANLIAQLIWFAVQGFYGRTQEYPIQKKDLKAYVVADKTLDMPISFYKSNKSDRWWFEIPKSLHSKHQLIPCSYQDYQLSCQGELPDRLLNAINRLT